MKNYFLILLPIVFFSTCSSGEDDPDSITVQSYFPPIGSNVWETKAPAALNWNETQIQPLLDYLELKHSKSFIVLVDGKIVLEHYFNEHTANSPWYWASAGKTLTATVIGIAEQEGFLNVNDRVSDHLGTGWTSIPIGKENLITNQNLLSMNSGLNDALGDGVSKENLQYVADAGTRWAYHNVYVKLQDVIAAVTGMTWQNYFNSRLRDKIGMTGMWIASGKSGDLSVYWSNTRSMARFGLMVLNNGKWKTENIVNENYLNAATSTSQELNKSYGYLWWLNGKSSYHLPQTQFEFPGSIIPTAPSDMIMALGKNDQKIYIVPSKKMVVIRMGEAADDVNAALSDFDVELWNKINAVIE